MTLSDYSKNTSITYIIETEIYGAIIKQVLHIDPTRHLHEWIINTREEQFVEALVKLGWTPPNEHNKP